MKPLKGYAITLKHGTGEIKSDFGFSGRLFIFPLKWQAQRHAGELERVIPVLISELPPKRKGKR